MNFFFNPLTHTESFFFLGYVLAGILFCLCLVFQEQALSCVLVGVFTRESVSGACFGSVFQEQALLCVGR